MEYLVEDMQEIQSQIADILFKLYIVNPNVAAIQQPDGRYVTKYFTFNSKVLFKMLANNGSMGCYQQGYKNGLVKWICLDFDCNDKKNPDVQWLYEQAVKPCVKYLKKVNIQYLMEFSGRRGIHIWIIFDSVLEKREAFHILENILLQVKYPDDIKKKFTIDCFPATASALGNKVGKQVKIPLSVHKKGGRSFFFEEVLDMDITERYDFWIVQKNILNAYKTNNVEECMRNLDLHKKNIEMYYKYHQYRIVKGTTCTTEQIIGILSNTIVYKNIFERLRCGVKENRDWFVLLGTLKYFDDSEDILNEIFSISPLYQKEITREKIRQWKDIYNPATFGYLYDIYHLQMEQNLDAAMTGFFYLIRELGVEGQFIETKQIQQINETSAFRNADCIRKKELNYIRDNDEVISIAYWNKLNYLLGYDLNKIDELVCQIKKGKQKKVNLCEYSVYTRKEKDKERKLVSLGAEERIITTYLAMLLAYNLKGGWKSYSYNLMFLSDTEIFYNWYSSWENFIDSIRSYLEVPYLEDYGIMELDLKSFYDSVDYLSIYQLIRGKLSEENKNIMECLVDYNDNLMRSINNGYRVGIPQGPAYARIIAEYYMSIIMDGLEKKCPELQKGEYKFSRYVDDMFLVYDENIDGEIAYKQIKNLIEKYGLRLNLNKSFVHGRIKDINEKQKAEILRSNKLHYEFMENESNWTLNLTDKFNRFNTSIFAKEFSIDDVSYVFGKMQNIFYQKMYYDKYAINIFSANEGRGSAFIRFYRFVFDNEYCLINAIENLLFFKIPLNSINFKNCISQMYLAKQEKSLDLKNFGLYEVLERWLKYKIDEEEICIIRALLVNRSEGTADE